MLTGHLYELVIVLVIALVIFGPKRLPELGSSLGKGIREFRKATTELQESIKSEPVEPLPAERHTTFSTTTVTPEFTTTHRENENTPVR